MLQLKISLASPWRAAIQGALIGDAVGVPHEFKPAYLVPIPADVNMVMPAEYPKSHAAIPYGTWSDDGSQLLALLDALHRGGGHYDSSVFTENLLAWYRQSRFQAGGLVFDVGGQTRLALSAWEAGQPLVPMGGAYCGNGSLMRVLPVATLPDTFGVAQEDALLTAMAQSDVTHPQLLARVACALYVELCWAVAARPDVPVRNLAAAAELTLRQRGILSKPEHDSLTELMAFSRTGMPTGSGFVVNTFWSAIWAFERSDSLSTALQMAVSLGNDTDTVACVAGGLAALRSGLDSTAEAWWHQMNLDHCLI